MDFLTGGARGRRDFFLNSLDFVTGADESSSFDSSSASGSAAFSAYSSSLASGFSRNLAMSSSKSLMYLIIRSKSFDIGVPQEIRDEHNEGK